MAASEKVLLKKLSAFKRPLEDTSGKCAVNKTNHV